ncbi:MAG: DUF3617 family protein [Burkholderiales bacterium]
MRTPKAHFAVACAIAIASTTGAAQMMPQQPKTFIAGSGPDDLWEVTGKTEMSGMSMPSQTSQQCFKKSRNVGEESVPKIDNCKVTEMRTQGNKTIFAMECTGEEPMTVRGETSATPTSFDMRMSMKGTRKGSDLQMTMTSQGKRIGACTDQTEQYVANAKAQGQAEIAKVCGEASEKFYYSMFSQGQVCESQRKAFCDKVGAMAPGMMKPAGFRAAVDKPGVDNVRGAFDVCKPLVARLDFKATANAACGEAAGTADWGFLGNGACDGQLMQYAPQKCVGRDYYTVDKSLVPMCNRYAMLTRGNAPGAAQGSAQGGAPGQPAQAQPTQAAQPQPAQPDPIKQGVDAVRKLLPF